MTEQYSVRIEEFELKLNDAEAKIRGDNMLGLSYIQKGNSYQLSNFDFATLLNCLE